MINFSFRLGNNIFSFQWILCSEGAGPHFIFAKRNVMIIIMFNPETTEQIITIHRIMNSHLILVVYTTQVCV